MKVYTAFNKLSYLAIRAMRPISWNNLIEIYLGRNMIGDRGLKYISIIEMSRIEKIDICIIIMNEL